MCRMSSQIKVKFFEDLVRMRRNMRQKMCRYFGF